MHLKLMYLEGSSLLLGQAISIATFYFQADQLKNLMLRNNLKKKFGVLKKKTHDFFAKTYKYIMHQTNRLHTENIIKKKEEEKSRFSKNKVKFVRNNYS